MSDDPQNNAFNPLPPILWILALPAIAVEIALSLGASPFVGAPEAVGWRNAAIVDYGFSGPALRWMLETGQYPFTYVMRFVTYPFVHYGPMATVFSLVFLLALGNMVARIFASWAIVAIYFGAAMVGALVYGLVTDTAFVLAGGFPAGYGLIGAYSFVLWVNLAATGGRQSQAFTLIAFLMGLQLLFGIIYDGPPDWVADLAGFATGFGLSFLVCPGGWRNALAMIRRRGG